jgi:putative ABC transport system permease protein
VRALPAHFRYILKSLGRNKLRTLLTVLGILGAILLFCFLESLLAAFSSGVQMADAARLVIRNAVSLTQPLPLAYKERILRMEGVSDITWANWFGGNYESDRNEFFAQFAVDPESYLRLYPEYVLTKEDKDTFLERRDSCILGRKLAERLGKKKGDTLVLKGSIYAGTWDFEIVGLYQGAEDKTDETNMFFHWARLDLSQAEAIQGYCGIYIVRIDDPTAAADVSKRIDDDFESGAFATRTETERAFALSFVSMLGNVALLLRSIGAAVVFTILMVAANTMMMATRERTAEIGVLKAIGYPNRTVFFLILGEALILSLVGGGLGTGIARSLFDFLDFDFFGFLPYFRCPWIVVVEGMVLAVITGLVSGVPPAWRAARLPVADSIRRV